MKTETLRHPEYPTTISVHTLDKGETHFSGNDKYISYGPGHVVIQEQEGSWDWAEYDLNQDKFLDRVSRLKGAGFKAI